MIDFIGNNCPKCGYSKRKGWRELDDDELIIVRKLALNTDYSEEERKGHHFCTRCWYEFLPRESDKYGENV